MHTLNTQLNKRCLTQTQARNGCSVTIYSAKNLPNCNTTKGPVKKNFLNLKKKENLPTKNSKRDLNYPFNLIMSKIKQLLGAGGGGNREVY